MIKFVLLFVTLFLYSEPVLLKNENVYSDLTPNVYIQDKGENFSKEKILELFHEKKLIKYPELKTSFDWTTEQFWYVFQIQTDENYSSKNYIYLESPYIYDIRLECSGKKKFSFITGTKYKFSVRSVSHKFFLFPLNLEKNDLTTCVIFQDTNGGRRIFNFKIASERYLLDEANQMEVFYGIVYGILIFAIINTIILLFILRKSIYLYYLMYIIFISFVIQSGIGHLSRFLDFFQLSDFTHKFGTLSIPLAVMGSILFTKEFFEISSRENKIYSLILKISASLPIPLAIFTMISPDLKLPIQMNNFYALFCLLFGFYMGIVAWRKGYTYARFYVWSFLIIFIGVSMATILAQSGVRASIANSFIHISVLIEIFLLSLALADKQKIVEQEKDNAIRETISIQIEANETLEKKVIERTSELNEEKNKSDKLLLNILPNQIADELKNSGKVVPREYFASILFTDFHGFTKISEKLSPEELVSELDECFRFFDSLMDKYNLEKLKTIGDSFMCAGGIPIENNTHPFDICKAAIEMREFISERNKDLSKQNKPIFEIRIGIHVGKIIAGVIGDKKFTYDVWGDTVNIASRMESSSEVGKINISEALNEIIKDKFITTPRGEIYAKNKGELKMFFLENESN